MVLSNPSTSSNFGVAMPAFAIKISMRSMLSILLQNSLTLSKDARSRCHTSTTPIRPVLSSIEAFPNAPLASLRQARITSFALRRTKCLAASRPRPQFEPSHDQLMTTCCEGEIDEFLIGKIGSTAGSAILFPAHVQISGIPFILESVMPGRCRETCGKIQNKIARSLAELFSNGESSN